MKAIKLQRGNKLHHYWLSQYIKGIVNCSIHHLELLSNQMAAFPFAILNSCPITGQATILNYCPIRWLLSICHLAFSSNQRWLAPSYPPPWHRTLSSTLLYYKVYTEFPFLTVTFVQNWFLLKYKSAGAQKSPWQCLVSDRLRQCHYQINLKICFNCKIDE